eukprot:CAMPEP_0180550944 /NCGR_PEP_ID=MMETSP1036_2-20121128/72919_1 /TAXON_ID=632150 /ORGANISM="Azadinium spinosum, Strain 3D9" /LENGTH=81 /DNA_ID=CAMNT_0022566239 /DNA_START=27 /DNA_END=268 /DNA_ORIENTATION=+
MTFFDMFQGKVLSEERLGHVQLKAVIEDRRLAHLCKLNMCGSEYFVQGLHDATDISVQAEAEEWAASSTATATAAQGKGHV